MRPGAVVRALDYIVEACWLLALVAVPIFFDTMTVRIFEPDKIALFRNIILVMLLTVLLRAIAAAPAAMARANAARPAPEDGAGAVAPPWWREQIARRPLFIPVIIFTLIYTAATITSVLPGISFWGSYDRMQGLYTWLNYIALFFVLAYRVRTWAQIERIVSAIVFTSVPVALYGILQKLQWDPVQWGADTTTRVASSLGNSIFLGAYLLMCMPFAAYRLWRAVERLRARASAPAPLQTSAPQRGPQRGRPRQVRPRERDTIEITGLHPIIPVIGYALVLFISFWALYFSGSRGPYYGFVVAAFILGIPFTLKFSNPYPAIGSIALAVALVLFPDAMKVFNTATQTAVAAGTSTGASIGADTGHLTDFSDTGTGQVRLYIWQGSKPLILHRPILGSGPETMIYVYSPYYPSGLGHIERSNAAPDRNHDIWLDFLVFSGVLGLLAWLAVLGTFAFVAFRVWRRTPSRRATLLISCVVAVTIGDLVEASVGIPIVSTLMVLWTMFALAAVLYARPDLLGLDTAAFSSASLSPGASAADARPAALAAAMPASAGTGATGSRGGSATATAAARRQGQDPGSNGARGRAQGGAQGGTQRQRHGRQPGDRSAGSRANQRSAAAPVSFDALRAGQQGALLGLIVLALIGLVGGFLLFSNNLQVVRADAAYKLGQQYDQIGSACLQGPANCPVQGAQGLPAAQVLNYAGQQAIPQALSYFQQATGEQPNQDMYLLWEGKTYLDEAQYYLTMMQQPASQTNSPQQDQQNAIAQFQSAESTLRQARALNPYNADHPMNLARMYSLWARYDPAKWPLADQYYRIATGRTLAWHNGRWADEWGRSDLLQAQVRPGLTAAQRLAIQQQALASFQHACAVDDLLGDARSFRGQAYQAIAQSEQALGRPAQALADEKLAAASYAEALKVGNFEPGATQNTAGKVVQGLISALYTTHDYKGLVSPVSTGKAPSAPYTGQSPLTLALSPTIAGDFTQPFSQTLPRIQAVLRQKGLLK